MAYIGASPSNGVRRKHTYTATASQTTFSGAGAEGVSLNYRDSNYVDVYVNGVKLGDADYTATSGTSIVLGVGAAVNDIVEIMAYDVFSVADTVSKADGGTFDGNVTMAGTLAVTGETTLATHLNMGDNDIIKLGDSADLQIYHDGTDSVIKDTGTGNLVVTSNGGGIFFRNNEETETYANFNNNGSVELRYDNSQKLATTSTGIDVTGTAVTDGLTVAGNVSIDGGTIKLDGNYPTSTDNVALGDTALDSLTSGTRNVGIGSQALTANTDGNENTAVGRRAMLSNTSGTYNVGVGERALSSNTTGDNNSAVGKGALTANTTGIRNVAIGMNALDANTTSNDSVAVGWGSLTNNTGAQNTAVGTTALESNTSGTNNVAMGYNALSANTTSNNNTAVGQQAGVLTTGERNSFIGSEVAKSNTSGQHNVAIGFQALFSNTTATQNSVIGYQAGYSNVTGENNTYLGRLAGYSTTGGNNTFIGGNAGYLITSGGDNTIIGRFNGNQQSLDIRTSSNNIVLSDGDGSPRLVIKGDYTKITPNYSTATRANDSNHVLHQDNGDITAFIENTNASNPYGLYIDFSQASPDNNTEYFLRCEDSTTARLIIRSDGDVQNHDNSYSAISDVKLKEQITDASSQWEDIKALTVRKYKMKTDVATGDSDEHWRLGVVAQEVEEAGMGGLVNDNPDLDRNNNDLGTTTKTVKYSILYMKAVKALQEAMTRIETLEAKVATLEGE